MSQHNLPIKVGTHGGRGRLQIESWLRSFHSGTLGFTGHSRSTLSVLKYLIGVDIFGGPVQQLAECWSLDLQSKS